MQLSCQSIYQYPLAIANPQNCSQTENTWVSGRPTQLHMQVPHGCKAFRTPCPEQHRYPEHTACWWHLLNTSAVEAVEDLRVPHALVCAECGRPAPLGTPGITHSRQGTTGHTLPPPFQGHRAQHTHLHLHSPSQCRLCTQPVPTPAVRCRHCSLPVGLGGVNGPPTSGHHSLCRGLGTLGNGRTLGQ